MKPRNTKSLRKNVEETLSEQVYLSLSIPDPQLCILPLSLDSSLRYVGASALWNHTISRLWMAYIWYKVYATVSSLVLNLWPGFLPSR
jgi:hypothetical protein